MSTRVTRSRTASAAVDSLIAAAPAPAAKKRKTQPKAKLAKPKTQEAPLPPPLPTTAYTRAPFVLDDAVAHLTAVDVRFATLFDRIPCKPFIDAADGQPVAGAALAAAASATAADKDKDPNSPAETDPFSSLVRSIIGQQVSWMAARSITKRFVEHFCGVQDNYDDIRTSKGVFPTCAQVAASDVVALKGVGCSTRKAEYLIELAQHFTTGRLTNEFLLNASDEEVAKALIAVRGIGRWTVDMFLIFTLRRPDVLPVGDLGVQKGLLRWVLAAHGALDPPKTPKVPKTPKKGSVANGTPVEPATPNPLAASSSTATLLNEPPTPTPTRGESLSEYVLVTPSKLPSTPAPPPITPSASTNPLLPKASDSILATPVGWCTEDARKSAPLPDGLNVATLRSRLAGKKAKGGVYLLPEEMEALTHAWRPYRSLGVYYTWSIADGGVTS